MARINCVPARWWMPGRTRAALTSLQVLRQMAGPNRGMRLPANATASQERRQDRGSRAASNLGATREVMGRGTGKAMGKVTGRGTARISARTKTRTGTRIKGPDEPIPFIYSSTRRHHPADGGDFAGGHRGLPAIACIDPAAEGQSDD